MQELITCKWCDEVLDVAENSAQVCSDCIPKLKQTRDAIADLQTSHARIKQTQMSIWDRDSSYYEQWVDELNKHIAKFDMAPYDKDESFVITYKGSVTQ